MKTIKSVLLSALVALVGSSVWAVTIQSDYINFASGLKTVNYKRITSDKSPTKWTAWSESPEFVTATIEGGTGEGTEASKSTLADTNTAKAVVHLVPNAKKNTSPIVAHFENDVGDVLTITARVDVVACQNVHLKHPESEDDPQGWFEIDPAEYPGVIPDNFTAADSHAYSTDTNIVRVVEKNGKYYLHAPVDGQDGQARGVFIKSEAGVLDNNEKIWMFYVTVSTVELEKWLTFPDESKKDSEATLNIRAHYLNVTNEPVSKVLFVGSGCGTHGLTLDKLAGAATALREHADIDTYIFQAGESVAQATANGRVKHFDKGTAAITPAMMGVTELPGSNHANLNGFYDLFYQLASNEETRYKYDYIVMEFDGERLAGSASGVTDTYSISTPEDRRKHAVVAEWLNEYYEGKKDSDGARIVWVVDDQLNTWRDENDHDKGTVTVLGNESPEDFFRPNQIDTRGGINERGENNNWSAKNNIGATRFIGLLGLLNPWIVLENRFWECATDAACTTALQNWANKDPANRQHTYQVRGTSGETTSSRDSYVGEKFAWQTTYNESGEDLNAYLVSRIQQTSYSATITDNVETQGLSFVENTLKIYGSYTTNEVGVTDASTDGWADLQNPMPGMYVEGDVSDLGHNSISGKVDQLTREFWTWIQVGLKDTDGSFRAGAKKDYPTAGKSSRDPNLNTNALDHTLGEAACTGFYAASKPKDVVYDEAETLWDWEFDSLPITLKTWGVNRPYDGTSTNATYTVDPSEDEGTEIQVAYSTDKTTWTDFEGYNKNKFTDCTNVWARFVATKDGYLSATSEAQVVIRPLPVTVTLVGSTNKYDALGHTVTVNVNPKQDVGDSSRKTELSFSTDNSTWSDWVAENKAVPPAFTNCGTYTVYAKVRNLPNYTNDAVVSADVVITQRVITVTATAAKKTYGDGDPTFAWTWSGDYVLKEKSWIESQLGSKTEGITRISAGAGSQERAGLYANALSSNVAFSAGQNYIVNFVPGDFTIEPGQLKLTAKDYSGVYDGEGHTIDLQINVTNDTNGSGIFIRTSTDNVNWSKWTKWPAGDVKDILPMATNVADSMTVYVQATNQWLLTFGAAPAPTYTRNSIGNYKPASTSAKVTITPVSAKLTAGDLYKDYDALDPDPNTATVMTNGVIAADAGKDLFIYTMSMGSHNENPGKKTGVVKISGEKNQGNYTLTFVNGSLTIGPKPPSPHTPCAPAAEEDVARVFQMQLNVYTTEGRAVGGIGGSQCAPGGCIVIRGKGKAMLRGYVFVCGNACELTDYLDVFCDAYHAGAFFNNVLKAEDPTDVEPCLKWSFAHAIGKNMTDAETAWAFKGTVNYDPKSESPRTATYELTGAGYGQFNGEMFNDFSGCFAGTVSQTFDHVSPKTSANSACLCAPSQIVTCDSNGMWITDEEGSVAFGKWKMKYNASASKAYAAGRWNPITAITKAMAH